jgi:hypothetical protein
MNRKPGELITPIYFKTIGSDASAPHDKVYYLLTGNGLFLCRNHELFTSCVPARQWPTELERQQPFVEAAFPPVPRELLEQAVGFFHWAYKERGAEAVVLLTMHRRTREAGLLVPEQVAKSFRNARGEAFAMSVRYTPPGALPADVAVFGDIHSHADLAAYASAQDKDDESYATGLHVVVGRLDEEPPQFHAEVVVDGHRFAAEPKQVLGEYNQRDLAFPRQWISRHTVTYDEAWGSSYGSGTTNGSWST